MTIGVFRGAAEGAATCARILRSFTCKPIEAEKQALGSAAPIGLDDPKVLEGWFGVPDEDTFMISNGSLAAIFAEVPPAAIDAKMFEKLLAPLLSIFGGTWSSLRRVRRAAVVGQLDLHRSPSQGRAIDKGDGGSVTVASSRHDRFMKTRGFAAVIAALGFMSGACGEGPEEALATDQAAIGFGASTTADPTQHTVVTFNLHSPGFNNFGITSQSICEDWAEEDGGDVACWAMVCQAEHLDFAFCPPPYQGAAVNACKREHADRRISEMADVIAETGADVVVLQEVDKYTGRSSSGLEAPRDMTLQIEQHLETRTGQPWFNTHRQACTVDGTGLYGDAMLSTTPFSLSRITLNGDDQQECGGLPEENCAPYEAVQQMQAIHANVRGQRIFGLHLIPMADCEYVRTEQIQNIQAALQPGEPTIIAGDFNRHEPEVMGYFPDFFNGTKLLTNSVVNPQCGEAKIDHVITRNIPNEEDFQANEFGGYESSDHLAVALSIPQEWDKIVPVKLGSSGTRGLFFYKANGAPNNQGRGEVYRVGSQSQLQFRSYHDTLRSSWHTIIAGDFDADGHDDDLLFYDRTAGRGEFHRVDNDGNLQWFKTFTGWRTSWDIITAVRVGPSAQGIIFFDSTGGQGPPNGYLQIYKITNTAGDLTSVYQNGLWLSTVTAIVAGDFDSGSAKDGFLSYDPWQRRGTFYRVNSSGSLTTLASFNSWRATWDDIIPVQMPGVSNTSLLFHDRTGSNVGASLTQLYRTDTWTSLAETHWDRFWTTITPQYMTTEIAGEELFFYDRILHIWEVWGMTTAPFLMIAGTPDNPWRPNPVWGTRLGGTASQSNLRRGYNPDWASDGNVNTMAHTNIQASPWWQINLGSKKHITRVRVHQRSGCCIERLNNFTVQWTQNVDAAGQCDFSAGFIPGIPHREDIPLQAVRTFSIGRDARCVRIQSNRTDYLNLTEVEVWGRASVASD